MTIKEMLEKRAVVYKDMEDIGAKAKAEGRALNKEEREKFDKADEDFEGLSASIRAQEKLDKRTAEMAEQAHQAEEKGGQRGGDTPGQKEADERRSKVFRNWLVSGINGLTDEERSIMRSFTPKSTEKRDMSTTGANGGYTIPQGFMYELEKALKYFGNVREVARIVPTDSGNDIPWPMTNDTSNVGELLGEGSGAAEADPSFTNATLKAYKWSSKTVQISLELLNDSAFNLEAELAQMFAERIGRIENTYFTTGTGTSQPQGVVTAANGTGITNAAATAIAYADLLELFHGLNIAYRKDAKWMFKDSTLKAIKLLSIGTNYTQPLWLPSISQGDPDTILGKPYGINEDMAAIGTGNISTLFGDFKKYIVREVPSFTMMRRLDEKYIENGQIGFIMFTRSSGHGLNAGGNPIKKLTHA